MKYFLICDLSQVLVLFASVADVISSVKTENSEALFDQEGSLSLSEGLLFLRILPSTTNFSLGCWGRFLTTIVDSN